METSIFNEISQFPKGKYPLISEMCGDIKKMYRNEMDDLKLDCYF